MYACRVAESKNVWGRVDADGTVSVNDGGWRTVGQVVDAASPEEALALFETRFADLEAQVSLLEQRAKAGASARDLVNAVEVLVVALTEPHAVGDIPSLRARVAAVAESIAGLKEKQDAASKEAIEATIAARTAIVERAEAIAAQINGSIHWRNAHKEFTELFEAWKNEQKQQFRVPKKVADDLWNRFKSARNTFDKAQRTFFQSKHAADKEAKSAKTELCEKAEALAPRGADAIGDYRRLLDDWKKAPRAGRQLDNQLWDRFKAAGDALYNAGAEEWNANLAAKQSLLTEYADIVTLTDVDVAKKRFRELRTKWEAIGNVARADERKVSDQLRAIEKHVRGLESEHLDRTNPEKVGRREGFAAQVESAIEELELKLAQASASEKAALQAEIAAKREWLAAIG